MKAFLTFTLQAPMASWGDIAVGEVRGTWDRPSRSAVIGLLGGALGLLRDDQENLMELTRGYGVGVRSDAFGTLLQDYHTMQTVAKSRLKNRAIATRAEMMSVADKITVLSQRAYRVGTMHTIAVWERDKVKWALKQLADALASPVFSLYAGRRSNPLGLPLSPTVLMANSLAHAFLLRPPLPQNATTALRQLRPREGWGREVAHDQCEGFDSGLVGPFRRHVRRDVPANRTGWLFSERVMQVGLLPDYEGLE